MLVAVVILAALFVLACPAVAISPTAHHSASSRHDPTSSIRAQAPERASTDRGEVAEPQGRMPRGRRAWGQPKKRYQAGRVVREKTFEGREIRYQYDARGRLHRLEHADGTWRAFRYNDGALLLAEDTPDTHLELQRDGLGRLAEAALTHGDETVTTQFQRDQRGRVIAEIQQGQRISYTRDVEGVPRPTKTEQGEPDTEAEGTSATLAKKLS